MKAKRTLDAPEESHVQFAALAAAVHPNWHESILRLANDLEGISAKLDQVRECKEQGTFVKRCRSLITTLIDVLDAIDGDPDFEPSLAIRSFYRQAGADECEVPEDDELSGDEREPSLASSENHHRQTWWAQGCRDEREEGCDDEGAGYAL